MASKRRGSRATTYHDRGVNSRCPIGNRPEGSVEGSDNLEALSYFDRSYKRFMDAVASSYIIGK